MNTDNNIQWSTVITAHRPLLKLDLGSVWNYRDLIGMFVKRDFVSFYKQTVLGPLWHVVQPVLTTVILAAIFGRIANLPTDGAPLFPFYFTGLIIWNYFSSCLSRCSDIFTTNSGIFGKVYFPRLTVPLSIVITNLLTLLIQLTLGILIVGLFWLNGSKIHITLWILALPVIVAYVAALSLGLGILISSLTTRYRDLTFLVGFGLQLWMYASPLVYPLSLVPEKWRWVMALNPMAVALETFRAALLGTGTIEPMHAVCGIAITSVVLFAGLLLFSRIEQTSVDTV